MSMMDTQVIVMAIVGVVAFFSAAALGKLLIPQLRRLHFGQTIREEGPAWHQSKQGTPTMGGLIFIAVTAVVTLVTVLVCELFTDHRVLTASENAALKLFAPLLLALGCGVIGFADDFIKVVKKRNLGLTAKQKLIAQLLISLTFSLLLYFADSDTLRVPFFGDVKFGIWYIPFCVFTIIAMSNATNLTDGVDGLCTSVSFFATLPFIIIAGIVSAFGDGILLVAFGGALAGFLLWNLHPAQVFMGDTGSLFIGGLLAGVAFALQQPFLLIPVGIVYILENLSVILQVGYFKLTKGKRLFKMAPLHHHFEMCKWSENVIVFVFTAVTLLGCVGAMLLYFKA